jgi:hypothetical protein
MIMSEYKGALYCWSIDRISVIDDGTKIDAMQRDNEQSVNIVGKRLERERAKNMNDMRKIAKQGNDDHTRVVRDRQIEWE